MNHGPVFSYSLRVLAVALAMGAIVGTDSSARALQAPPAPVAATVPNLVAYWPFDETSPGTAQDFSGNANHGTPIGPTISTSIPPMTYHGAGANLRSLDFVQSSSQFVAVSSSASLSMTGSYTISAWIQPKTGSTGQRGIVTKWEATGTGGYDMRLEGTKVLALGNFDANPSPGIQSVSTFPRALTEGTWTHVAATYDTNGGIIKLYVNAMKDATEGTAIAAPSASGAELQIGQAQGSQFFHGNIDEVRIYNRALLDTEIAVLKDGQEAPTGLVAAGQAGQVHLTWNAPTGGAPTSYSVLRGPSAGAYDTVFNDIPANVNPSYDDTTAAPGTTYHYVVVAVSVLASDYSNSSSAVATSGTPPPPPGPPPPPRTKKLGERHMCGWSTVSASSWPGLLGALLLAAALGWPALRRRIKA